MAAQSNDSSEARSAESRRAECRERIDSVDRRLVALLNERTEIVETIGQLKKGAQLPVYEPRREELVYANIVANNNGPLSSDALRRIFERVIDEMRKIQRERMAEDIQKLAGTDK